MRWGAADGLSWIDSIGRYLTGADLPTIQIRCIAESEPFEYMEEFGVDTRRELIDQKRLFRCTETRAHSAILLQQYGIRASNALIVPCNLYIQA